LPAAHAAMARYAIFVEDGFYLCVEIYFFMRSTECKSGYRKKHNHRNKRGFFYFEPSASKIVKGIKGMEKLENQI
jgi:hypothetical protein